MLGLRKIKPEGFKQKWAYMADYVSRTAAPYLTLSWNDSSSHW